MEEDQRLTPLPRTRELKEVVGEYPAAYSSYYDDEAIDGRRSIKQYIDVVYKRLPLILALTILVTAAAAFYMYRQPSEYQATTEMLIEPRKPKVTTSININFGNDINYYNTQLKLLQNVDLIKAVVVDLGLYQNPNLFDDQNRGIGATMRSIFTRQESNTERENALPVISPVEGNSADDKKIILTPEENARAELYAATLAGRLTVEQRERTNLVYVTVKTYNNPGLAVSVANRVAEKFRDRAAERETEGAKQQRNDLAKSIEELKGNIFQKENEYISEMRSSDLPLQEKGGELRAGNLEALLGQWRDAQNESGKLQATYSAAIAASAKGDILSVVGDNKAIQDARSQNLKRQADLENRIEEIDKKINDANEKRENLLARYTPEYKEVVAISAQVNELENQKARIDKEVSDKIKSEGVKLEKNAEREVLASLRSQLSAAEQREARQRAAYEQAAAKANVEGQAETKLTGLRREIESNRSLLDTYTQRLKEKELEIANSTPDNISIAAMAITPTVPVGPNRTRNIFIAFLISLAAGLGLAFLMDYLDDSVKTSDDIGRLGLPTLALIPHHYLTEKRRMSLVPKNGNGVAPATAMIALEERHSPMAEAYRHLRTSLLFSSAGKPPQTILVTSSQPSEGKTTTAINTAITLAQSDVDVILIDCDLRRPRLHSYFDMENTRGLTNYLSGEQDTEHLIKRCKGLPKLRVITSGPIPPNPAELLSSDEMKKLLQFLRGRYKHVIIDSPPAISFTDAAILSTLVDGVVLVAMAGKSSIHLMRRFKQRLGNIGARIYGVVLNGIKSSSIEYDYYGSGYYDYYGKSEADETPYIEDAAPVPKKKR